MAEANDSAEIRNGRYGASVTPDGHGVVPHVTFAAGNGATIALAMPLGGRQVDALVAWLEAAKLPAAAPTEEK